MRPYYEHGGITIYHGDCRDVLPNLPIADLVLTDAPYGIASIWKGGHGHGWGNARAQSGTRNAWDIEPPSSDTIDAVIAHGKMAILWGGNYFVLPPSRGWLVWTKPERGFSLAEAELAWTNRDNVIRVFDGPRSDIGREHPTQKPLCLMIWCLQFQAGTVIDPFMGSGTTLVAAKTQGRMATGIEREERYCEIAAKRLAQEVLPL